MLQSFDVLDEGKIKPEKSKYAMYFINKLKQLKGQEVLNFIRSITSDTMIYLSAFFDYVSVGECYTYADIRGEKIVKEGKIAIITLAGGMGSRALSHRRVCGCFPGGPYSGWNDEKACFLLGLSPVSPVHQVRWRAVTLAVISFQRLDTDPVRDRLFTDFKRFPQFTHAFLNRQIHTMLTKHFSKRFRRLDISGFD